MKNVFLGIDLGTTKVAAVLVDEAGKMLGASSMAHHADLPSAVPGVAEQSPEKIWDCMMQCVKGLPKDLRLLVTQVGVTGQMHSILIEENDETSSLVTWQDHRCGPEMLEDFRRRSGALLREGFGGTTLARLAAEGGLKREFRAAAISDWVTARLAGRRNIVTDPTHAASWGVFNMAAGAWNQKALECLDIPMEIMPEIQPCGAMTGTLSAAVAEILGVPGGIPVKNAIGDNQASILGTGTDFDHELYLTLGTGAQLSCVVNSMPRNLPESLEIRPFPNGKFLLVSAPLCGGAAFAWLADSINRFRKELGEEALPMGPLLDRLDEMGLDVLKTGKEPAVVIEPHFLGERHDPALSGKISGLDLKNCTPGNLAAALALGIVRNLMAGLPKDVLACRTKVVGSGNAVRLVKSIQYAVQKEFKLPLSLPDLREEAACGAAWALKMS